MPPCGPLAFVLPDVPGPDHAIHGPTRRVRVSLEVSIGQVAVGDTPIHPQVGHRSICPLLEVLAFRAGIVFAPVAAALSLLSFFGVVAPGASYGPAGIGS